VLLHAQTKSLNYIRASWEILLSPSLKNIPLFIAHLHIIVLTPGSWHVSNWFAFYFNSFYYGTTVNMHIAERPVQHVIFPLNACGCLTSVSRASVRGICVCVRSESNSITGFSHWLRTDWCMWLIYSSNFHMLRQTSAITSFVRSLSIHSGSIQTSIPYWFTLFSSLSIRS